MEKVSLAKLVQGNQPMYQMIQCLSHCLDEKTVHSTGTQKNPRDSEILQSGKSCDSSCSLLHPINISRKNFQSFTCPVLLSVTGLVLFCL